MFDRYHFECHKRRLRIHPSRLEEMKTEENNWDDGKTPLMASARCGNIAVVEFLLSLGANIEATKNGKTALTLAATRGHSHVVELLLEGGANINHKDKVYWFIGFH